MQDKASGPNNNPANVRLYFRLDRLAGKTATGIQLPVKCRLGQHRTKDSVYNAVGIGFDKNKHMEIQVYTACIEHVPAGSWVEGRDKPTREADPQGDRWAEKVAKRYLN